VSSCGTTYWVLNPIVGIRGMVIACTSNPATCYAMKYTRIRDLLGYWIYVP